MSYYWQQQRWQGQKNQPVATNYTPAQEDWACPTEPGTILRIYIPAGAVINLGPLLEISSPSGVCLLVRIPLLAGVNTTSTMNVDDIIQAVRQAGGTVEFQ